MIIKVSLNGKRDNNPELDLNLLRYVPFEPASGTFLAVVLLMSGLCLYIQNMTLLHFQVSGHDILLVTT